jgi:hypothetical protein
VKDRSEEFIVLRVDPVRKTADLLSLGKIRQVESDVPWLSLCEWSDPSPKTLEVLDPDAKTPGSMKPDFNSQN